MNEQLILSVSQINTYIKETLDYDTLLGSVCIRGELSNYKRYPSGHNYFTLKDAESSLRCVMFRSNAMRLRFRPENGMTVLAAGRVTVYPRDGVYQLYCVSMMPEGAGDLAVAFEQLKRKLESEGLFDAANKKRIPLMPSRVAIVTSSAGAAVHDILRIMRNRFPAAEALVVPVRVQGDGAAEEIAKAIRYVNRHRLADVIITGRGGGSLEDLWAFNTETVARAIFDSEIPVVTAVGHEPDVTIADFVADVRASTPSNAAELVVPEQHELRTLLTDYSFRMNNGLRREIEFQRRRLQDIQSKHVLKAPTVYLDDKRQQVDNDMMRILNAMTVRIQNEQLKLDSRQIALNRSAERLHERRKHALYALSGKLDALSPLKVLARGYAIVSTQNGNVLSTTEALSVEDTIRIRFAEGTALIKIKSVTEEI